LAKKPNTMLAYLLDSDMKSESVQFPWDHPICPDLPEPIQERILHARNFSDTIHGASLLYNLMLAEKMEASSGQIHEGLTSHYADKLMEWADDLQSRRDEIDQWDNQRRFWQILSEAGANVTGQTFRFIMQWLRIALSSGGAQRIAENESARRLIHERERLLKRNLARLDNAEALARWSGDAGTGRLRYRWRPAETIISDILLGLRRS